MGGTGFGTGTGFILGLGLAAEEAAVAGVIGGLVAVDTIANLSFAGFMLGGAGAVVLVPVAYFTYMSLPLCNDECQNP